MAYQPTADTLETKQQKFKRPRTSVNSTEVLGKKSQSLDLKYAKLPNRSNARLIGGNKSYKSIPSKVQFAVQTEE